MDQLVEVSLLNPTYVLLLVLSVLIVVAGLLIGSAAVIIGGMVVAPLLSPILTMAMGVVVADFKLIKKATVTLLVSIVVAVLFSVLLSLFHLDRELNSEIMERTQVSFAHLIIAVAAGVAAAFAFVKPNISPTITGIAVSVALLPPIATTGIGIVMIDWIVVSGSFKLFALNLFGIIAAATSVFSLMKFYTVRREASIKLKEEEQHEIIKT